MVFFRRFMSRWHKNSHSNLLAALLTSKRKQTVTPVVSIITFGAMAYVDNDGEKKDPLQHRTLSIPTTQPQEEKTVLHTDRHRRHIRRPILPLDGLAAGHRRIRRQRQLPMETFLMDGHGRRHFQFSLHLQWEEKNWKREKNKGSSPRRKKQRLPPPPTGSHRRKKQHTCVKCFVTHKNFCNNSTYSNNVTRGNAHKSIACDGTNSVARFRAALLQNLLSFPLICLFTMDCRVLSYASAPVGNGIQPYQSTITPRVKCISHTYPMKKITFCFISPYTGIFNGPMHIQRYDLFNFSGKSVYINVIMVDLINIPHAPEQKDTFI